MNRAKLVVTFLVALMGSLSLSYAQKNILIVVTNNKEVQAHLAGKDTVIAGGYELSEVSQAYEVFTKSGFNVDFMSPKGGMTYYEPEEKMSDLNKAFINNPKIMAKLENTLAPDAINTSDYEAVYFAGGKTMWDFPNNKGFARIIAEVYESEGIVGAVCHGPAALVNVKLSDGSNLVEGKKISSFTDMEEKLFSKTAKFLPFMLQEKLTSLGADFQEAPAMFDQVVVDGRLITGQNPMSTYSVAEEMVKVLGKTPPQRPWVDVTYTLEVIKNIVLEDEKAAKKFMKKHGDKAKLEQGLFQQYAIYGNAGHLGEVVKSKGFELLQFAAEQFPESAKVHEELAKSYHEQGKNEKAITSIKKSLSLDPNSESATKLLKELEG